MIGIGCSAYFVVRVAGVPTAYALAIVTGLAIWPVLLWRAKTGMLVVTDDGLTYNGRRLAAWPRITSLLPAGTRGVVVRWRGALGPRTDTLEVVDATATARMVQLAARRLPRQEIEAGRGLLDVGFLLAFVAACIVGTRTAPVGLALSLVVLALGYARSIIVLGADGLSTVGWRRSRFVPASRIADCVALDTGRLRIDLDDGELLVLRLPRDGEDARDTELNRAYADSVAERVRALRHDGPDLSDAQRDALQRGARSPGAWLAALRGAAPAPHRAALSREVLWQVAESPGDDEERVAALAALAPGRDPADRVRVEALAVETASPRLRVASRGVLSDDDADVERALRSVVPRRTDSH